MIKGDIKWITKIRLSDIEDLNVLSKIDPINALMTNFMMQSLI